MDLPKMLDQLHHAYVSSGDANELITALEVCGVPRSGCPDVYIHECQEFRIDEARSLRERAILNPIVLSRRIFIIQCASIAHEAQNALLKTLEEPRGNAVFFFLTPSPARLLPTFRSRVQVIGGDRVMTSLINIPAFLRATPMERIVMLEIFTKKKEDEERDMQSIGIFLDALERALSSKKDGLKAVYLAKKYVHDRGAIIKHLLEQTALLV